LSNRSRHTLADGVLVRATSRIDRLARRLDHDRQPQRFMHQLFTVMNRLPGQARAQTAAVALDHADAAHHVVNELVAAAEHLRHHRRAVVLQADPACHDDRRGDDQLQRAEAVIGRQS
jgi:hypothetical protein